MEGSKQQQHPGSWEYDLHYLDPTDFTQMNAKSARLAEIIAAGERQQKKEAERKRLVIELKSITKISKTQLRQMKNQGSNERQQHQQVRLQQEKQFSKNHHDLDEEEEAFIFEVTTETPKSKRS